MALEGKNHNFACPCLFFFYYLKIDGIRLDCSGPLILQSPSGVVDHAKKDQFSSVTQSSPTLCNPMNCSMPGFTVHYQLPELAQTHVHQVGDAIQPSNPLSSPSPATCSVFLPGKFRGQRCLVGSNPWLQSNCKQSDTTKQLHFLSFSPPAFNLSQHQDLFQWAHSSQQVAKVLEFQLQHQSFQWIFRTDFL